MSILKEIIPYKERTEKLDRAGSFAGSDKDEKFDAFYDYLVNTWIINQPDKDKLMELFILVGFSALAFVELIINGSLEVTAKEYGVEV